MRFQIQFSTTGLYRLAGVIEGVLLVWVVSHYGFLFGLFAYLLTRYIISLLLASLVDALDRMTARSSGL